MYQGPIFQQSKEAVHCGRFGALGTKLKFEKKMAPGRDRKGQENMVDFFIHFARLVAIIGG